MILFLDFDGVMHPDLCPRSEWFERLPMFERWLRGHDQIEVVISSSWRNVVPWRESSIGSGRTSGRGSSARPRSLSGAVDRGG